MNNFFIISQWVGGGGLFSHMYIFKSGDFKQVEVVLTELMCCSCQVYSLEPIKI